MKYADWPAVAAAVLRGEFKGADKSTVESIVIGLRSRTDADSVAAVKRLRPEKPTPF